MIDGLLIINNEGVIEFQNRESRRIWNGNFIGHNYFDIAHEKKGSESPIEKCLSSGVAQEGKTTILNRELCLISSPVFDQDGQITHVVNIARETPEKEK